MARNATPVTGELLTFNEVCCALFECVYYSPIDDDTEFYACPADAMGDSFRWVYYDICGDCIIDTFGGVLAPDVGWVRDHAEWLVMRVG